MKNKFLYAILAIACMCSCSDDLYEQLKRAQNSGIPMFGHQDDLMYGYKWTSLESGGNSFEKSDVFDVAGDYPAVLGLDLGGLEVDNECNLDGNDFESMRKAARIHYRRGGIVTLSWHLLNPLTGGDAWDVSTPGVVASILPGGDNHDKFMTWLDKVADYIEALEIPVIFRPFHEHSGNWFWWGVQDCTSEEFNMLWNMTYTYLTKEKKIHNMLWAISPDANGIEFENWEERYPGDDVVDIIGLDYYDYNLGNKYSEALREALLKMQAFSKEHNKLMALTECGDEAIPNAGWWTGILGPAIDGIDICYLLVWRNANDAVKHNHYYGPHPDSPSAADFSEMVRNKKIALLSTNR